MPRKRYSRRNRRRSSRRGRPSRVRRNVRRRGVRRIRNLGYLIPDRLRMALPYYDGTDSFPAAASNECSYRGNSIYDPDFTGIGDSPFLFDQMMALYTNFYVSGSRIRVETFQAVDAVVPRRTVVFPHISSMATFSYAYWQAYAEQPFAKSYSETIDNAGKRSVCNHYMSTPRMLQTGKSSRTDPDCLGTIATNPAITWYWNIFTESIDGAEAMVGWRSVKIIYFVEFSARKIVAPS